MRMIRKNNIIKYVLLIILIKIIKKFKDKIYFKGYNLNNC